MQRSSTASVWRKNTTLRPHMDTHQNLPTYDPLSHVAQRELSRLRSARNAVHLIPLLILLCAVILWFFSSPLNRPTS